MEVKRLRSLLTQVFKIINDENPNFMKNIFRAKSNAQVRSIDILVKKHNVGTPGDRIILMLRIEIWNELLRNIKGESLLSKFREYIKL